MITYQNKEVAKVATTTFSRHLWHLSEVLEGFGFYDDDVSAEEKRMMVVALKENDGCHQPLKWIAQLPKPAAKGLHDFVTSSTTRFFLRFLVSEKFLQLDPAEWKQDDRYRKDKETVQSLRS